MSTSTSRLPRLGISTQETGTAVTAPPLWRTADGRPDWPKSAIRVAFGVIWAIDAGLKWQPGFRADYMSTLMGQAQGQPGWLHWWFRFWIDLQHPYPTLFAYLAATVETLIAVALILGFARKLTYLGAVGFSLLIWATAEGFGGPYTHESTDIGTAVVYAVVFLALLAISAQEGTSRYSVDALLERRISWWHWIAEVGGHHRYRPATTAGALDSSAVSASDNGSEESPRGRAGPQARP